jgi:hypothetical protein
MPQKFTNQAKAALAGNITAGATSLAVNAGLADLFPVANTVNWVTPLDWYKALIVDNAGQVEVIKVGTRAAGSGAFTNVQRGQDGTTAKAFTAGSAWVVHGPMASDFAQALAGIFAQFTATNGVVGAAWRINAGILTLSQTDAAGNILADRFTFDQTNGTMTVVDLAFSSDERLKTGWKRMPRFFLQRMVDEVKRGIYRRKGTKRLEAGVGAQSLRDRAMVGACGRQGRALGELRAGGPRDRAGGGRVAPRARGRGHGPARTHRTAGAPQVIPVTGLVTGAMLRAEFGMGNGAIASLNAVTAMRRAAGVAPGAAFKMSDLRGSHTIKATTLNASILALMGNPVLPSARYRLVIAPGIGVGSNNPTQFAADTGQFPSGSTLTIDIYGGLEGAGGLFGVASGRGGGALYAPYLNQTVIVNPMPGSALLAGGGAGGKGGDGGAGGAGGPDGTQGPRYDANNKVSFVGADSEFTFVWDGVSVGTSGAQPSMRVATTTRATVLRSLPLAVSTSSAPTRAAPRTRSPRRALALAVLVAGRASVASAVAAKAMTARTHPAQQAPAAALA